MPEDQTALFAALDQPLPAHSQLYIARPPIEALAYSSIQQPGCLLRIQAAEQMGKRSLLNRLLAQASADCATVHLDLRHADPALFASLDKFLRWFCTSITQQLQLDVTPEDYWDEEMSSKVNCKLYAELGWLNRLSTPLLLAIDAIDRLFDYAIAPDVLSMLRAWHEQAKQAEIWQNLRLILTHSTALYVPITLNQSPFNVGVALRLPPFTAEQIQELAYCYWDDPVPYSPADWQPLIELIGGHPYLVNLALYQLRYGDATLKTLRQAAPDIYRLHFQHLAVALSPDLLAGYRQVIADGGALPPIVAYKLEGLGLIQFRGNQAVPGCELYRLHFQP